MHANHRRVKRRASEVVIRVDGDVAFVPLSEGKVAVIDAEDVDGVKAWCWSLQKRKHANYAGRHVLRDGKHLILLLHRFLMNPPDDVEIDHVDHDGLNNRKSNLRFSTDAQNSQNSRPQSNKSSRFKGVSWSEREKKWEARIKSKKVTKFIGYFTDEEQAARAYDAKARSMFGEWAYLNFGEPPEVKA